MPQHKLWYLHFMTTSKEKTWVYIDSFNLYYGALNRKGPKTLGLKWLDLESWLTKVFPMNDIQKIKLFTARVSGKFDPTKPVRQDTYFRALRTLKTVEIIEGTFSFRKKRIHITQDVDLYAMIPEEKGTDVNLATHLVNDAYKKCFQTAIIVSNDSDLAGAVKIVTQEVILKVGIFNPYPSFAKELTRYCTFQGPVREWAIRNSQFPRVLTDSVGQFNKPPSW